jgi:Domain of unknown function (DUF4439)
MTDTPDDLTLWQETLAVEHAVIWGFGVVGSVAGLDGAAETTLRVHRDRRATCTEMIVDMGGDPVASAPAYDVSRPPDGNAGRRLAADLEASTCIAYSGLAGARVRDTRLLAARWLREGAIAQTAWAGVVPALPGLEQN